MTTYLHTGAAIANYKVVKITPGPNANSDSIVTIALGPYQLTFTGWNANAISTAWNASANPFFQQITASINGTSLILTSNILGQDFEVTVSIDGNSGTVSAIQVLTVFATGGSFTLSDGTLTTGAISYSANAATLRTNIQTAINALSGYSSGDVEVTGSGPFMLEFGSGRFAGLSVPLWTAVSSLTGGNATATVTTTTNGNAGTNEIITISFPAAGTHTEIVNEIQEINVNSAVSGEFILTVPTYGSTNPIPFTAGRSRIKTELENLVGLDNTIVTGGPLSVLADPTLSYLNGTLTNDGQVGLNGSTTFSSNNTAGVSLHYEVPTPTNNLAGLFRFTLAAARGTTVDTATLSFTIAGLDGVLTPPAKVWCVGYSTDNPTWPANYAAAAAYLSSPTPSPENHASNVITGGLGDRISFDVTDTIQDRINQSDWTSGDAIILYLQLPELTSGSCGLVVESIESATDNKASLQCIIVGNPTETTATLTDSGTAQYEPTSDSYANFDDSVTELPFGGGDNQYGTAFAALTHSGTYYRDSGTLVGPIDANDGMDIGGTTTPNRVGYGLVRFSTPLASPTGDPIGLRLVFHSVNGISGDCDVTVRAFKELNPDLPTNTSGLGSTFTTATVTKTVLATTDPLTPVKFDVTAILAELYAQGGWTNTNHVLFEITAVGATSTVGMVFHGNTTIGLGHNPELAYYDDIDGTNESFIRYTLPISAGSVPAATLTVTKAAATSGTEANPTVTVHAVLADNPDWPASEGDLSYTLTTASSSQVIADADTVGTTYDIDIAAIVLEVINQPDWTSGDAIILRLSGGFNDAIGYLDTDPTLVVEAVAGGGGTYTRYPVTVQFVNEVGGINVGSMSANTIATVSTVQNGGTQIVDNIVGGTWTLRVTNPTTSTTYTIADIPYDVTASELDALIEEVCGAGTVTVTGGPAPDTPLVVEFTGALQKTALTEVITAALTGNFVTSSELVTLREAISPPEVDNCWDMTVIPGEGTLAIANTDPLLSRGLLIITISEPASINPASILDNNIYVPLLNINPARIETAINEAYGKDVVRVTRIVHSLEHASIPAHTDYASVTTAATPLHFWYYRDVFRLVFVNAYQPAGSILDVSVRIANISNSNPHPASPALWMVPTTAPNSNDTQDLYHESQRTYLGFTNYLTNEQAEPYHEFSCVRNTNTVSNKLSYRVKLLPQYRGSVNFTNELTPVVDIKRAGVVRQILDNSIVFSWVKFSPEDPTDYPPSYYTICSTQPINWDASTDQIKAALSTIVPGFMASVVVTGTLYNSWLSEATTDAPLPEDSYNDLRITLTGKLAHLPLTELGYTLVASIIPNLDSPDLRMPRVWIEPYSVPLPGGLNHRQRFSLASAEDVSSLVLTIDGHLISGLTPATTAAQLETLIATAIGNVPVGGNPILGGFNASGWAVPIPNKWRNPVSVYGTTLADPIELEYSGFGFQYSSHTTSISVAGDYTPIIFVETQAGVNPVPEVQHLTIIGNPHGGTYTIDGGASLAYNANAAAIQADLGVTPVVTGTYPAFMLTWPSSAGNVAQLATTSSLNNSFVAVSATDPGSQEGGLGAAATVSDHVPGTGPLYLDCPQNYSPAVVFGSDDTLVIDDTVTGISFGLDMSSYFTVIELGNSGSTFKHIRNRIVFQDNQKVYLTGTGTTPAGLTFGDAYYIINADNFYTFQLAETPSGEPITVTTIGTGTFRLTLRNVTLTVYSRYAGNAIGLPNNNSATALPEYLPKYLVLPGITTDIGVGDGNGLSLLRLNSDDRPATILIQQSGQSGTNNIPAILLLCNHEDTNITVLDGDVGIAVYSQEESLLNNLTVSGGSITIHNTTVAGTLTTSNGVAPVIQSGCTIAGLVTIE